MRVAVAAVLVAAASARNFGPVNIDGVGQKYLLAPDWSAGNIQMNGDSGFTLNGGGRVYLGNSPNDGWDPNNYWQTPLNEMHFSYTLDLSNVGCHCNAAGYFIGMPGPGGGDGGDYYCDANFVGGQWCPEYDTLESNKHTIAGTLHTVSSPQRPPAQVKLESNWNLFPSLFWLRAFWQYLCSTLGRVTCCKSVWYCPSSPNLSFPHPVATHLLVSIISPLSGKHMVSTLAVSSISWLRNTRARSL